MLGRDVIELRPSQPRRLLAVGVLACLALLLALIAFSDPLRLPARLVLLALAAAVLWMADRLRLATLGGLRLTPEGIETLDGTPVAPMDDILSVDRGVFAFKPSNGFLLRLRARRPARWVPGLWWARGRRIGVGGVTSAGAAKAMAEEIALRIARRDG